MLLDARIDGSDLVIAVSNQGEPIEPGMLAQQLFEPFQRGRGTGAGEGLGLGPYICAQIARAHGGTLTAQSTPAVTVFTTRLPVDG